jgi:PAS domain S-box-containing protein
MFSITKINVKLTAGFCLAAIIPTFLVMVISLKQIENSLTEANFQRISSITTLKKEKIELFFEKLANDITIIQDYTIIKEYLPILETYRDNPSDSKYIEAKSALDLQLSTWSKTRGEIADFILVSTDGTILYATNDWHAGEHIGKPLPDPEGLAFLEGKKQIYLTDVFHSEFTSNGFGMLVTAPIVNANLQNIGVIALEIDMTPIYKMIADHTSLGDTGETLIGRNEGDHALFLNPLRHDQKAGLTKKAVYANSASLPIREATQWKAGSSFTMDYRSVPVLATWTPLQLPSKNLIWGLVTKIDTAEVIAPLVAIQRTIINLTIGFLVVILLLSYFFARSISMPIANLRGAMQEIASGSFQVKIAVKGSDEIADLGNMFNMMVQRLQSANKNIEESTKELEDIVQETTKQNTNLEDSKNATLNILEDLKNEADNTKKFQQAVEGSTNPIAITSPQLELLYVNPAWELATGYKASEVIGKIPDFLVNDKMESEFFNKASEWVQHGDSYHSDDFIFKRKDGTTYNVDFTMYPIMGEEAPVFLVNIHHNITRRKREEVAKSDFVSIASHQLRTPLTTMRWTLEMFLKGKAGSITDKQKELMNDAYQCSLHMTETISSMLMLSKIEAEKLRPQPAEVNLQTLFEEVKDSQKAAHIEKKQEIHIQCFEEPVAYADPALLREVIMNLLSNAIKYTPNGGSISVTAKNQADDSVLIEVSDTGYGIPPRQQDQVFTKFFRADNIVNLPESGTGLGLHLAYNLVNLLQGKISFLSKENTGTTFSISLPIPPTL